VDFTPFLAALIFCSLSGDFGLPALAAPIFRFVSSGMTTSNSGWGAAFMVIEEFWMPASP
jgi:hypothetical protein